MPDLRRMIEGCFLRVDEYIYRLNINISGRMQASKSRLANAVARLDTLSPLAVLKRGYAIAKKVPSMEILKTSGEVSVGDRLELRLYEGELRCRVEEKI
jgi:exodeoxyribonuclease VII large subunit